MTDFFFHHIVYTDNTMKGNNKMIQIITFLFAQLMFVPAFLKVTDTCTENKSKLGQKIEIVLLSPFATYLYTNLFFGLVLATIPAPVANNIVKAADVIIILQSFVFVNLYTRLCTRIVPWNKIYYASVYMTFFLLQMAFNYTYTTIAGSLLCNILVPSVVIYYFTKKLAPLYVSIKEKPDVKVSRSLFLLPAMAELFFIFRNLVITCISERYPEVALNDIPANTILTIFAYILLGFVFVCITALLRNILDEQGIMLETEKNKELTTDMIKALVKTIDAKDPYTNGHSIRVAEYSKLLAEQVYTDPDIIHNIYNIALLHDIGKIGIPDSIINKSGKLTKEEYDIIKGHTLTGAQILSEITAVPDLIYGAKYHHERYDGKGYPCGLKGEEIPEVSALIAVADAYDAMTSNRSYRNPLSQEIVKEEIENGLGTQFHPKWGKLMLKLIEKDTSYTMHQ